MKKMIFASLLCTSDVWGMDPSPKRSFSEMQGSPSMQISYEKSRIEELEISASDLLTMNIDEIAPTLKSLKISGNTGINEQEFGRLSRLLSRATNLQSLRFGWNGLTTLPPELFSLTNLQYLDLQFNELTSLPSEIGNLKNLQRLDLYANQLTTLPPEIWNLTNLRYLNLGETQLTSLPYEVINLTHLQRLYLPRNRLTELPKEVGKLKNLQKLDLEENQLTELPTELWSLTNLQELYLMRNQLIELPNEIGELKNLQRLELYDNLLTSLPPEIGELKNLQYLNLDNNNLRSLPNEIVNLRKLDRLDFCSNNFNKLPPKLWNLIDCNQMFEYRDAFFIGFNWRTIDFSKYPEIDSIDKIPDGVFRLADLERIIWMSPNGELMGCSKQRIPEIREQRIRTLEGKIETLEEKILTVGKILEAINYLSLNGISFVREEVETHVNSLSHFREQHSFSERLLEELKEARDAGREDGFGEWI